LYVQSDDGSLTAWFIPEPKREKGRAPDVAGDES